MCTCFGVAKVKIRKHRQCFGCERSFAVGAEMVTHKQRGESSVYTLHLCPLCDQAVSAFIGYGDSYGQGGLRDFHEALVPATEV